MAVNPGYTRRKELICTLAEATTYASVIPLNGEAIYIKQSDGKYGVKIGDGSTTLANLPYSINYSDINTLKTAAETAKTAAETAQSNAASSATSAASSAASAGSAASAAIASVRDNTVLIDSDGKFYVNT